MIFDWQPGHTAPRDGRAILVEVAGQMYFSRWEPGIAGVDVPERWCEVVGGLWVMWKREVVR